MARTHDPSGRIRHKSLKLMVNKGRIGPKRILFVKSTEVKMHPVYLI